ncbi:uncharacterized protein LOC123411274 isoform X3 [Hordeum vulgare subsp. vulgare]|uniref:uncharacterized protein LOC123411274 isoform X3 n=1 Tax=Hordeum vulgare subsp. vulgare TaxID=112509 RepID=UPI000B464050|nr:uncharacterized protein LOC123411274 isoform X3 [Hordeum vulgare subsp. vulgare]
MSHDLERPSPATSAGSAPRASSTRMPTPTALCSFSAELLEQMVGFGSLVPKTKNLVVGGGLTGFVFGVYYYTMRAVGNTDELQVAIDKFEDLKKRDNAATPAANPSTPGSSCWPSFMFRRDVQDEEVRRSTKFLIIEASFF